MQDNLLTIFRLPIHGKFLFSKMANWGDYLYCVVWMVKKQHNHTLYTIYLARQYPKPISDFAKPCEKKVLVVEMYDAKKKKSQN